MEQLRELFPELVLEAYPRCPPLRLDEAAESRAVGEQSRRPTAGGLEGGGGVHAKVIGVRERAANPWRE